MRRLSEPDAGQQRGSVEEVTLAVARVGGVGGGLEDQCTERTRDRAGRRRAFDDLQARVDGAPQRLGPAYDADHLVATQFLDHPRCGMVSDQHVDLILDGAGDEVDGSGAPYEAVRGVVACVDARLEPVAE